MPRRPTIATIIIFFFFIAEPRPRPAATPATPADRLSTTDHTRPPTLSAVHLASSSGCQPACWCCSRWFLPPRQPCKPRHFNPADTAAGRTASSPDRRDPTLLRNQWCRQSPTAAAAAPPFLSGSHGRAMQDSAVSPAVAASAYSDAADHLYSMLRTR